MKRIAESVRFYLFIFLFSQIMLFETVRDQSSCMLECSKGTRLVCILIRHGCPCLL